MIGATVFITSLLGNDGAKPVTVKCTLRILTIISIK
jgi:hypothetical protein